MWAAACSCWGGQRKERFRPWKQFKFSIGTLAFPSCWSPSFMHSEALRRAELNTSARWPDKCAAWELKRWRVEARKSQIICSFKSVWLSVPPKEGRVVSWPPQTTNPLAQFPRFMKSGIFISSNYVHPFVLAGPSSKAQCRRVWANSHICSSVPLCVCLCLHTGLFTYVCPYAWGTVIRQAARGWERTKEDRGGNECQRGGQTGKTGYKETNTRNKTGIFIFILYQYTV